MSEGSAIAKPTAQMEAFCQEYIKDFNGKRAALAANYTESTADKQLAGILGNPRVQYRLSQLMQGRNERLKVDADYVLQRLMQIDEMDVQDILDDDGAIKPVKQWPKIWRQMVTSFDVAEMSGEDQATVIMKKIKFPDKVKNLELLGKHTDVNAWLTKLEVDVTSQEEVAARIARGRQRNSDQDSPD